MQGGGCRCFFQLGLLETGGEALGRFDEIAAVSAASAMAVAHLLGVHGEAFALFARRVRGNPRNFYPGRLLRLERPTPHLAMYRDTVLECVDGERLARLRAHPTRLRLLVGLAPGRSSALAVALAASAAVRRRTSRWMAPHALEVSELETPVELAQAILTSSAFPPFTPVARIGGRVALDGGLVESVPLGLLGPGERIALLTLPRPHQPLPPSVRVIAPARPLEVAMWDYASVERITRVYDQGRRAGEALRAAAVF